MPPDQAWDPHDATDVPFTGTGTQPLPVTPSTQTEARPAGPGEQARPQHPREPGPHEPAGTSPWTSRRGLVLVGCALAGILIGVGAQQLTSGDGAREGALATPTSSAAPTPVQVDVSSFDPQGSGFPRSSGGVWSSQTYASQEFGNLKPGIGLLLDLGTAQPLKAVAFNAATGPLTVQLRAADSKAAGVDGYQQVGSAVEAKGTTTLPAAGGGSHRYWLIWVTRLGPTKQAQIGAVQAER